MPVLREQRQVSSIGPVGVVRSRGGDAERYNRLANATQQLTELAISEMGRQAERSGAEKAQQLDIEKITAINPETGKPEALDWINSSRFIGRKGAEAYERVVADRFQFEIEQQIENKAKEVALTYSDTPYAEKEYAEVMNTYIDGLAEGSKVGGKATEYTNFIYRAGSTFVAASTLSLRRKQKEIEDRKILQALGQRNEKDSDVAYYLGQGGDLTKFRKTLEANEARNQDLIDSGVQTNVDVKTASSETLKSNYVSGAIEGIFSKQDNTGNRVTTSNDRRLIEIAIRRGKADLLPEELRKQVEPLLPYVSETNKRAVLAEMAAYSADYDAIENDIKAQQSVDLKAAQNASALVYENQADSNKITYYNQFSTAYNSGDPISADMLLKSFDMDINNKIRQMQDATQKQDHKSLEQNLRRSALEPVVSIIGADGNPTDAKTYLRGGNLNVGNRLTPRQRKVIDFLRSNPSFYDSGLDLVFVEQMLEGTDDEVQAGIDAYKRSSDFKNTTTDLINDISNGDAGSEEVNKRIEEINNSTDLDDTEKDNEKKRLLFNSANAIVNGLPEQNSRELNNIAEFVSSNGNNNMGLSDDSLEAAQDIINATDETNRGKIVTEIIKKKNRVKSEETEAEKRLADEAKIAQNKVRAFSSSANKDKDVREAMDTILKDHGFTSALDRATMESPHFYELMKKTISQDLHVGLKSIGKGQVPNSDAEVIMRHYQVLSKLDNGKRNALIPTLTPTEIFRLDEISRLKGFYGDEKSFSDIISEITLNEVDKSRQNIRDFTLKIDDVQHTPSSFLATYVKYDGDVVGNDPLVQTMYEGAVEMMASNKVSPDLMQQKIEEDIAQRFAKDEYVVDPNGVIGGLTRHAISVSFPDKQEANVFVELVNSQLPRGYAIGEPEDIVVETEEVRRKGAKTGAPALVKREVVGQTKRVYLVPYSETDTEVIYFSHILSNTNELVPMYMNRNGDVLENEMDFISAEEVIHPAFDLTETNEWAEGEARKSQELLLAATLRNQQNAAAIRDGLAKRPRMFDGIAGIRETPFTRSLGALDRDKLIKYEGDR